MKFEDFSFGSIRIDGKLYTDDLILEDGRICLRDKASSRQYRSQFGHTPLSTEEKIPWNCRRLIIGTGVDGKLPVLPKVFAEAARRGVELEILPTARAIEQIERAPAGTTNAILHLTC